MTEYKKLLWDEIARNSPPTAKFIRDMHVNFGSRMHTFKWLRPPAIVLCKYERRAT
jgi:hypothetical protein